MYLADDFIQSDLHWIQDTHQFLQSSRTKAFLRSRNHTTKS